MTGERFIPFRKTSIVTMCADEVPAADRESFRAFTELLASLLHHEFRDTGVDDGEGRRLGDDR